MPIVQANEEWLLERHLVYCGDTAGPKFISLLPPKAALAIAAPSSTWHHDYLIDRAQIVAVILKEGQIHQFCSRQQMPFRFEFLLGEFYVGIFSRQALSKPRQPKEIEGIEGIVAYLINQYTSGNLGVFVLAPSLGNGEILIACERMGRICFAGDPDPQSVSRALGRWQHWTGKRAEKRSSR